LRIPGWPYGMSKQCPPPRTHPAARAFTLIELLVVVGIIAVLIAILIPSLALARRQSQFVACRANMRSLGQAALLYAEVNDGWIPRDYSAGEHDHPFWGYLFAVNLKLPMPAAFSGDSVMAPYFGRIGFYQCPAFPEPKQMIDFVLNGWDLNSPGGQSGAPIRISVLRRPSDMLMMTEANKTLRTDVYEYHDVWHPDHLPLGSGPRICNDQRHNGMLNCLYVDGHIQPRRFVDLKADDFRLNGP
jgi:prepilin-type N-terminal cleavage/methylation domain-containing protein/prepilin-type processing-associated H-X9-DG protein